MLRLLKGSGNENGTSRHKHTTFRNRIHALKTTAEMYDHV